jgi:hypothetical protein
MAADLTPFGYTTTENLAYGALLTLGPSSAYSVARRLSIARANAYQALDGLVAKGAASLVGTDPKRYRATLPRTLLAQLIDGQARKLDRLEAQIQAESGEGERPLVTLSGSRAVREVATRAILRAGQPVQCVGPADELEALAPAIRARAVSGREITVWAVGPGPATGVALSGTLPAGRFAPHFSAVPLLLLGDGALAAAPEPGKGLTGYWSEDHVFRGIVAAVIGALTAS